MRKAIACLVLAGMMCVHGGFDMYAAETPSKWAQETIAKAEKIGIHGGANGYQNYQAPISRWDMSVLVTEWLKLELNSEYMNAFSGMPNHPFKDVRTNHSSVNAMYTTGIMQGTSATSFSPEAPLTREQAAVIIVKAVRFIEQKKGLSILRQTANAKQYSDEKLISDWAKESVNTATENGILSCSEGQFRPKANLTYEEAVVILYQVYGKVVEVELDGMYTAEELAKMRYITDTYNQIAEKEIAMKANAFTQTPKTDGELVSGTVNPDYMQLGIDNVNLARYIAGVSNDVVIDEAYAPYAQAAAFVTELNKQLSHAPKRPVGMDERLYSLAYTGASRSNLCTNNLVSSVWDYMYDSDSKNAEHLGHRRWILNPLLGKMALGQSGRYSAMYVLDSSAKQTEKEQVAAWPSPLFPIEFMEKEIVWSVSIPNSYVKKGQTVTVQLTRKRDNRTWRMESDGRSGTKGYCWVDGATYGNMSAVMFRVNTENEKELYDKNDVFEVEISGLTKSVSYTVKLFDMKDREKME